MDCYEYDKFLPLTWPENYVISHARIFNYQHVWMTEVILNLYENVCKLVFREYVAHSSGLAVTLSTTQPGFNRLKFRQILPPFSGVE